jgi:hypothetical protein
MADMSSNAHKLLAAEGLLAVANRRIEQHPLNSGPLKEARDYVSEHRSEGREAVDQALSERGLPTTAMQGRAMLRGLTSLARLNRKRIKLERRIAHLRAREVH